MPFSVIRHTWPVGPSEDEQQPLARDVLKSFDTQDEAETFARDCAKEYEWSDYDAEDGYWWGRDKAFKYTFTVEGRPP